MKWQKCTNQPHLSKKKPIALLFNTQPVLVVEMELWGSGLLNIRWHYGVVVCCGGGLGAEQSMLWVVVWVDWGPLDAKIWASALWLKHS